MRASKRPRNRPKSLTEGEGNGQTVHTVTLQEQLWQGPLPPPQALSEFDSVVPGLAARIIDQWEAESIHRREYEKNALRGTIVRDRIGQISALAFAIAALVLAGYALHYDQAWVAGLLGGGTIASVVGAFLYQREASKPRG